MFKNLLWGTSGKQEEETPEKGPFVFKCGSILSVLTNVFPESKNESLSHFMGFDAISKNITLMKGNKLSIIELRNNQVETYANFDLILPNISGFHVVTTGKFII